jgi:hypothetical protein
VGTAVTGVIPVGSPEQGVDERALAALELADDRDVDQRLGKFGGRFGGEAALEGREHLEVGENA